MPSFLLKIKEHKILFLSLLFFLSSSFTIRLIAAPFTAPATLDPACAPGAADCYVITSSFSTGLTSTSGVVTSNLSTGVSGGQSVVGGTASGNNLTLSSTSNATKGKIVFGTSAYDEVNNRLGIGTVSPAYALSVGANSYTSGYVGTGTGADMHITGTYTGTANATYTITVDGGNDIFVSPNTIEIKKNGVVVSIYSGWGMDNLPTASPLSLGDGLSVGFDEGLSYYSDHDTGDIWTITATATGDVSVVGTYKIGANFFGSQNVDDGNLYLGKSTSFGVSTGTGNTHIGVSAGTATTTGYQNTLVGNTTGASILGGYANTLIGNGSGSSLTSGNSNTFLGNNSGASIVSGTNNLFLGINATGASTTTNSVALGSGATVTLNNSIAIGASATTTLANQMVIGSSSSAIDNVFIGNGVTTTTAGNVVLNATGGSGSNKAGGSITIAGGRGTGTTGVGGSVIFSTSDLGAGLATTAQTLTEKMRVDSTGKVGIGTNAPTSLFSVGTGSKFQVDTNGDIIKLNNVTTTFPASNTAGVLTNNGSGTMSWGSAITGMGTIDSVTKSANGAVISGANLIMQNADATYPGLVSTGVQSFAGAKTFGGSVDATGYTIAGDFFVNQIGTSMVFGKRTTNPPTLDAAAYNLLIGFHSGDSITGTSLRDTYIGGNAGQVDTSSDNTYVGAEAGYTITTGGNNTFIGSHSGYQATGIGNTYLGSNSGVSTDSGNYNTFIGYGASGATSTVNAVAFGHLASSASNGIAIGDNANTDGDAGSIALGSGATTTTTAQFMIGSTSYPIDSTKILGSASTQCTITTGTGIACTSDERLKTNIFDITDVLSNLSKVKTVTFNWLANPESSKQIGFLAQDLEQYFPELVATDSVGYKSVYYSQMTPILVEAIRELNLKVNNISTLTSSNGNGTSVVDQLIGAIVSLKELIADKITTKELCLEDVCITKTELQQLLQQGGVTPSSNAPAEAVAPVPQEIVTEVIPEPIPEVIVSEPIVEEIVVVPELIIEPVVDAIPEPVL